MNRKQRIGRAIFVTIFSLGVAWYSYTWITDPSGRAERALQESVVLVARARLAEAVDIAELEFVDPLAEQRKVGKVYIYRTEDGWEVSGYYRRNSDDEWHPWLMRMNAELMRTHLKVQDAGLVERAAGDPALEVTP